MQTGTRFGTVVFDCDSTLSAMEGIEVLAQLRDVDVAPLTEAAMRGEIPLEAVYGRRLELARPTRNDVLAVGQLYVERLIADAREVVQALHDEGVEVRILSGGLLPAVLVVAEALGVPPHRVAAVDVRFDADGSYAGFDTASPLWRSGGKPVVLRAWGDAMPRPVMLVGDGATDLETASVVDLFVAFAGVIDRPEVTAGAEVVLREPSLAGVLPLALGPHPPGSPQVRELFRKGLAGA